MRYLSNLIVATLVLLFVVSCDALNTVSKNTITSQGAPYELIVVSNQRQWDGAVGDTLRKVFAAEIPYLQQSEPMYNILRVTERGYDNLVTRHRNILITDIDPTMSESKATVQYDLNATPQIVVTVKSPSEESLLEYVSTNREKLLEVFDEAESDRAVKYAQKFSVKSIDALIKKKFGMEMKIPEGYTVRNDQPNFLWISYEYPTASQGVMIYKYPATKGAKSLSQADLTAARNKFAAMIPGAVDNSYMSTVEEFTPDYRAFRLNGRLWAELRGLWCVEGDFMGGPFVSYSTIDTTTGEVVTIDCYVYSPKLPKRNLIRGLEQLIHNVKFE